MYVNILDILYSDELDMKFYLFYLFYNRRCVYIFN